MVDLRFPRSTIEEMARRLRLASATLALSAALVFSLVGVFSASASAKPKGKVVSAKLTPKSSFTAAQATTTKLVCKFSPASKRVVFLLQMKKGSKWAKLRSTTKKGSIKTNTTTVNKLFGPNAVKVGQYRVKISADANSMTRTFTVAAPPPSESSSGDSSGDTSTTPSKTRGGGGDCGEDCGDGSGDDGSGGDDGGGDTTTTPAPGAFSKVSPTNGATGQSSSVTLSWSVSSDTSTYQYCVDTTKICHIPSPGVSTGWVSASSTTATVSGLHVGTTYYWQVYAVNMNVGQAGTYADGGTWFSFTVTS